jgi:hypothetical protein
MELPARKSGGTVTSCIFSSTGGWKRQTLTLLAALAVAGGFAIADTKPNTLGLKPQAIAISARALEGFDKEHSAKRRFGRLEWRGGLVLSSSSANFGGWSGLRVSPSGDRLVAVSDAGTWLTASIEYQNGRPTGLKSARIGPLLATSKGALLRPRDRDAEGIAIVEGTLEKGTALIAFEQHDRIGRFAIDGSGVAAPVGYLTIPPEMKRLRSNDGFEAITVLRGGPLKGALVGFAERLLPGEVHHSGWIWQKDAPKRAWLTDIDGFDLTDAASLPDGSLLFLERRFRWSEGVKMRIRRVPAGEVKPGTIMKGEVLIEANLNFEIDNMEGIGVHTSTSGETILTLISDDNFNPLLQRTILLQFALAATANSDNPVQNEARK